MTPAKAIQAAELIEAGSPLPMAGGPRDVRGRPPYRRGHDGRGPAPARLARGPRAHARRTARTGLGPGGHARFGDPHPAGVPGRSHPGAEPELEAVA